VSSGSATATTALAQAEWLDRGITAPAGGGIECSTKHLDHPDLGVSRSMSDR
jgi:hypothetical protein